MVESQKRILIVDDDDEIRELLEFDIRSSGYFVDSAKDGLEGLNKALNNTYDLTVFMLNCFLFTYVNCMSDLLRWIFFLFIR